MTRPLAALALSLLAAPAGAECIQSPELRVIDGDRLETGMGQIVAYVSETDPANKAGSSLSVRTPPMGAHHACAARHENLQTQVPKITTDTCYRRPYT